MKNICHLLRFDAHCNRNLEAQSAAVHIRLYLVPLLCEVKVRLGRDEYAGDVIYTVLLLYQVLYQSNVLVGVP